MPAEGTRPEDVLPGDRDTLTVRGVKVRKGSIAAAMRNMETLESGTAEEKQAAMATIRDLAPGLAALGMHRHFICRNPEVEAVLAAAAAELEARD
ncbi:MAG: hypothetical protein AAF495_26460 [Pseudomonadota bacterium]